MAPEKITKILNDLTKLLADDPSPHSISYQFDRMAALLSKENLRIEKIDCKEYYEDGDLSLILLMKNEALANAQFELASKFHFLETELLEEKGDNEFTQLKTEPFFFEYRSSRIIFHFNKREENQRLIANLIERHNLIHQKTRFYKMVSY
jgi:hypothetical protein